MYSFTRNLLLVTLLFSLGTVLQAQNKEVIDKIVGTVGGELILLSDVEEQFSLLQQQQGGGIEDEYRCIILENLLAQKLLLNQAKLDSIEVSEEEVEQQLNARIENILGYMNGNMAQFEAYYGRSINEVKEDFREDLRDQLLVQRMRSDVIASATVTPSEVKAFFARIPTDSLPYFNSEVEIGEIVYAPQVNAGEKAKARKKLTDLRKRIVEEEADFGDLAKIFSDDPGSARIGGDLGMQRRGTFVPEFEAAAYQLSKGEISEVIETEFGFHILELIERRGNNIHVRHILIKPEITSSDRELARAHLDSIRMLVNNDSLNFSLAVKRFSDEDQQSYNNDGLMMNPKTGNTFYEIGDLDPEIYFTIDTMTIGDVSAPIEFQLPSGGRSYRLILLKSRTDPHKASLASDYSKIKQATLEEKKNNFINEWVMDKMKNTFIQFDEIYRACPNMQAWLSETKP
ncbi:MAG: peptidylprolyl isomerase [Bacteroidota bacterium]